MRKNIAAILVMFVFLPSKPVQGDDSSTGTALTPSESKLLASATGDPDTAVLRRIARTLGTGKLTAAFYHGTRAARLTALDAAAYVDAPLTILPYLAALLSASDRQTASRAAGAFLSILADPEEMVSRQWEIVTGQAAQIISQLAPTAADPRLDADIRVAAIVGADYLSRYAPDADLRWTEPLLEDVEPAVRQAAIAALHLPLSKSAMMKLAGAATDDTVQRNRAAAGALLCENALFHGVLEPSPDLTALLTRVVQDGSVPPDAMVGVFTCLKRFKSGGNRQSIVDAARANSNPETVKLLDAIKLK